MSLDDVPDEFLNAFYENLDCSIDREYLLSLLLESLMDDKNYSKNISGVMNEFIEESRVNFHLDDGRVTLDHNRV